MTGRLLTLGIILTMGSGRAFATFPIEHQGNHEWSSNSEILLVRALKDSGGSVQRYDVCRLLVHGGPWAGYRPVLSIPSRARFPNLVLSPDRGRLCYVCDATETKGKPTLTLVDVATAEAASDTVDLPFYTVRREAVWSPDSKRVFLACGVEQSTLAYSLVAFDASTRTMATFCAGDRLKLVGFFADQGHLTYKCAVGDKWEYYAYDPAKDACYHRSKDSGWSPIPFSPHALCSLFLDLDGRIHNVAKGTSWPANKEDEFILPGACYSDEGHERCLLVLEGLLTPASIQVLRVVDARNGEPVAPDISVPSKFGVITHARVSPDGTLCSLAGPGHLLVYKWSTGELVFQTPTVVTE